MNKFLTFPMQVKEVKADGNTGFVSGFISTYGNVDLGDDVVEEGAFKKTIQENNGSFPALLDHSPYDPAGYQKVQEQPKGLFTEAELKLFDPRVKQRYELCKLSLEYGRPMGWSIGYGTIKEEWEKIVDDSGRTVRMVRHLKELKLYEASLVVFPMNTEAMVTAAKSWAKGLSVEESLDRYIDFLKNNGHSEKEISTALGSRAAIRSGEPLLDEHSVLQAFKEMENLFRVDA